MIFLFGSYFHCQDIFTFTGTLCNVTVLIVEVCSTENGRVCPGHWGIQNVSKKGLLCTSMLAKRMCSAENDRVGAGISFLQWEVIMFHRGGSFFLPFFLSLFLSWGGGGAKGNVGCGRKDL